MSDFIDGIWLGAAQKAVSEIEVSADNLVIGEMDGPIVHLFYDRPDGILFQMFTMKGQGETFDFNFYSGTGDGPTVGLAVGKNELSVRIGGTFRRLPLEGDASALASRLREIGRRTIANTRSCKEA
jgi:hypothetical protein